MKTKLNRKKYFQGYKKLKHVKLFESFVNEHKSENLDLSSEYSKIMVVDPEGKESEAELVGDVWLDEGSYGFSIGVKASDIPFVSTALIQREGGDAVLLGEWQDTNEEVFVEGEWDFSDALNELGFDEIMTKMCKLKWNKELLESGNVDLDAELKKQGH